MSSIDIKTATKTYGGSTEEEIVMNMAQKIGCYRIYKYANDFGDKKSHTDFKYIMNQQDPQEAALLRSPMVHNVVLVYDQGKIINKSIKN